ncbi:helix-turn-helix transcriptional regulator [Sphingobacterium alkalisoli]|uniref:Helix-turn-helix transcriptional regulator n=1 Tax=Sphingobacterium alkalisoli TaxID=1874115 RepID=A0A4U0GUC9_9SPHI|nr:TetR/AcrR family transcriptional regulator [Sphingobacterium alkalisoli]TJY62675.1 helix-turn-helix transcriptional regulator [Sphingobacterium alkalisoli]GGH28151.1 TetR family transcriptional regulator [Sphingobacterium alkalisoli]
MNVQLTEKIEIIFKSTLELICEKGFHGTPMSQIAKQSDVAIGTIYHYFPSKDNLIIELFCYCKQKINNYIFSDWDSTLSYKSRFFIVMRKFCAFYLENTDMFSFMEQFHNSPYLEISRNSWEKNLNEENNIMAFLYEGMRIAELRNINIYILTSSCIGIATSFAKKVIYGPLEFTDENLNEMIEIIWNGVKQQN